MKDFLHNTLPAGTRKLLDLNSITYDTNRYIEPEMQNRFSDLVVKTCIRRIGRDIACNVPTDIYFLFEHKSFNDPHTWLQIIRYPLLMWEKDAQNKKPLRLIIPYIFYHGKSEWKLSKNFSGQFTFSDELKQFIPHYEHLLFYTNKWNENDEKNHGMRQNIFLITSLMLMKHIFHLEHE